MEQRGQLADAAAAAGAVEQLAAAAGRRCTSGLEPGMGHRSTGPTAAGLAERCGRWLGQCGNEFVVHVLGPVEELRKYDGHEWYFGEHWWWWGYGPGGRAVEWTAVDGGFLLRKVIARGLVGGWVSE